MHEIQAREAEIEFQFQFNNKTIILNIRFQLQREIRKLTFILILNLCIQRNKTRFINGFQIF